MYYDEVYQNGAIAPLVHDSVSVPKRLNPTEIAYLRSYRTGFPRGGSYAMVPDHVADPWAWFLAQNKDRTIASSKRGSRSFVQDDGHSFLLEKHSASHYRDTISYMVSGRSYGAKNFILMPTSASVSANADFPVGGSQPRPKWANDLDAFGQQAIARSAPSKYAFDGAQFLAELREGLPKLAGMALIKGRVKDVLKNGGSEYLNYQFGWKPLVSDVKSAATTLVQLDRLLKQKQSEQGRPKRAHFGLPTRMASREWSTASYTPIAATNSLSRLLPPPTPYLPTPKELTGEGYLASVYAKDIYYLETLQTRRWFDGSFTSLLDYPAPDASWVTKAKALVNLELTPETLWELAPWSWLVDWAFRIQSSIAANAVAIDKSIVMNYGYVMERSSFRTMFRGSMGNYNSYALSKWSPFFLTTEDTYFTRRRANPFGFTVSSPSSLSVDQLAILAALGLSR